MLYLIEILHQTTTKFDDKCFVIGCILSKFYIKPQLSPRRNAGTDVVSYRNSTSNHNFLGFEDALDLVVSYRNSTSNHNTVTVFYLIGTLYLIEILHQTTTIRPDKIILLALYLIEILHQTTTLLPFLFSQIKLYLIEILHQTTTMPYTPLTISMLYLIEILHQTTTVAQTSATNAELYLIEILHQTTTTSRVNG